MEEELRELRDLVLQLRAENEKLKQDRAVTDAAVPRPGSSNASSASPADPPPANPDVLAEERFVFIPRDRKCPKFNGRVGMGIDEWVDEAEACMRVRRMSTADRAFFLFDHLEGEAREEIRYRPVVEREDPEKIISALRELYGCSQSYVALQEAFFSRRQHEGETLLEFSLALMGLLEKVKQRSPNGLPNADPLLRDQFVEHVRESNLRRELKQLVRRQPNSTLLEVRSEAIRWELEGTPGGARGRSHSVPSVQGFQYGVGGGAQTGIGGVLPHSELSELREMFKAQQKQLEQLTQSVTRLQGPLPHISSARSGPIICRRCHRPGHIARECVGERVAPHSRDPPRHADLPTGGRQSRFGQPSEN